MDVVDVIEVIDRNVELVVVVLLFEDVLLLSLVEAVDEPSRTVEVTWREEDATLELLDIKHAQALLVCFDR